MSSYLGTCHAIANNNSALVDSHYNRAEENQLIAEENSEICEVLSNSINDICEIVDQAEDLETVSSIRGEIMNIEKDANAEIRAIQNISKKESKIQESRSPPGKSPALIGDRPKGKKGSNSSLIL